MKILTLYPYWTGTAWVFDDPRTNLKAEAFVLGSSEVLTRLVGMKAIRDAEKGFTLQFSDERFEGFDAELTWLRSADAQVVPGQVGSASQLMGNWYCGLIDGMEMSGWLCPALGLWFLAAPSHLFVKVEPLPAGVNPVWKVSRDDLSTRRLVSAPE